MLGKMWGVRVREMTEKPLSFMACGPGWMVQHIGEGSGRRRPDVLYWACCFEVFSVPSEVCRYQTA